MARGRRNRPPAPAIRLRFTSARPNDERVVATTRSAASTISHPPAVASPSTATITGLLALAVDEPGEAAALGVERAGLPGVDRLEVGAGAEHRPLLALGVGGEDADPHLGVVLELIDRRLDAGGDIAVDGVARLGTVERDEADAAAGFVQNDVRHAADCTGAVRRSEPAVSAIGCRRPQRCRCQRSADRRLSSAP